MYSSYTGLNKDQNIMAPTIKKYFIYTIFLVSPIAASLHAQGTKAAVTASFDSKCEFTSQSILNQNNDIADDRISKLDDNSNQLIAGLSIPKDSLSIAAETNNQTTTNCQENTSITASYSVLAKDIIENYKYDFSETFIDILFFENIDLARTRTI
jgi:nitrogenase subunit NifH